VGDWRVLFLFERVLKIIAVEKLKSRAEERYTNESTDN
jgi:hypothetical protein